MEHGIAVGNFGDGAVGDAGNQNIGLGLQIFKRNAAALGVFLYMELHGLDLTVGDGVDGNGCTGLILHGADISNDVI